MITLSFCWVNAYFFLSAVPGRRQNTIVVKVPGHEDSHNEDGESGSEASDSVSNSGQLGNQSIGNNVTLITLNSEGKWGPTSKSWAQLGPPTKLELLGTGGAWGAKLHLLPCCVVLPLGQDN